MVSRMLCLNNSKIRREFMVSRYRQEEYDLHSPVMLASLLPSTSSGTHKISHVRRVLNVLAKINIGLQNGDTVHPTQRSDQPVMDM